MARMAALSGARAGALSWPLSLACRGRGRGFVGLPVLDGGRRLRSALARPFTAQQWFLFGRGAAQRKLQMSVSPVTALEANQGVFYSETGAERASERRTDSAWLADAFAQKDALVAPLLENKSLVSNGRAVFLMPSAMEGMDHNHLIFLGLSTAQKYPLFAVDLTELTLPDALRQKVDEGAEWVDARKYGPQLPESEAGLLAYARGMVEWQSRNRYCGHCGSKMLTKEGGHSLKCSSEICGRFCYPRMDPAVIVLVTCGNWVLLGRQARWDAGRYSLLAGFLEIGESFEKAVAREVKEEAGVEVDVNSVKYVASQPWPFPSSVMIGFTGTVQQKHVEPINGTPLPERRTFRTSVGPVSEVEEVNSLPEPTADGKELEDARWIHKAFLKSVFQGETLPHGQTFSVPGKYSISNYLLKMWVEDQSLSQWSAQNIPTVDIDEGTFKYVLIRINDKEENKTLIVRGSKAMEYHAEILEAARKELESLELHAEQLGGGRIAHEARARSLHVFGSSQAYGQADHTVTSALLRQSFPLHTITVSSDLDHAS